MKPMVYRITDSRVEILDRGEYNNFQYVIVSYGSHPCAYIELPKGHKYYGVDYDDIPVVCHGGLTYSSFNDIHSISDIQSQSDTYWIGWDYAHISDYVCFGDYSYSEHYERKKWTTEEILKEVKDVIEQLQ